MANDYMAKLAAELEGNRMDDLASMGRFGDTIVAHINPQEAQMLMEEGGSGTINPMTGLPEFFWSADTSADDDGSGGSDAGGGDLDYDYNLEEAADIAAAEQAAAEAAYTDAQTPEEQQYNLPPGTLDLVTGVGRGGPGEFAGIDSPTSKNVNDIINTMPSWLVPYYNAEKDKGKTNAETVAALQQALSIPGGAARMASGYSAGYSFGGPGGTMQAIVDDYLTDASVAIKAAEKKVREGYKEQEDRDALGAIEEVEPEETNYFGDLIGDIVGGVKDYFTGPTKEDELAYAQAAQDAGFTFNPMSDAEKYAGQGISYLTPGPIGFVKGIGDAIAFATDSRVLGNVDTPYGTFQLTESGDLQTTDFMGTGDVGGNELTITKKRKVATEKPKEEEEEKEEEDKPYFPEISTATLTPSEIQTITNIYGPDSYLLNENQTGLRTLV